MIYSVSGVGFRMTVRMTKIISFLSFSLRRHLSFVPIAGLRIFRSPRYADNRTTILPEFSTRPSRTNRRPNGGRERTRLDIPVARTVGILSLLISKSTYMRDKLPHGREDGFSPTPAYTEGKFSATWA